MYLREKRRGRERCGRKYAGERDGEENERIKNNKIILKNDI